jgi:hypothetical protein
MIIEKCFENLDFTSSNGCLVLSSLVLYLTLTGGDVR